MQAGGNDFIVLDNRKRILLKNCSRLAKRLCENKFSIGADGLLILEGNYPQNLPVNRGRNTCFQMRYFNADGSEANFCGNGASCLALFAYLLRRKASQKKIVSQKMNFSTKSGIVSAIVEKRKASWRPRLYTKGKVKLKMPNPQGVNLDFSLKIDGRRYLLSFVDTGVPHTVNFVEDINKIDVKNLGRKIRFHQFFQPEGTNVNFVKVKDRNTILIRTYERGVEDETLSCGTGVVAGAIIAGLKNLVKPPVGKHRLAVKVLTRSSETLKVYYQLNGKKVEDVYLENSPKIVFEGKIDI